MDDLVLVHFPPRPVWNSITAIIAATRFTYARGTLFPVIPQMSEYAPAFKAQI